MFVRWVKGLWLRGLILVGLSGCVPKSSSASPAHLFTHQLHCLTDLSEAACHAFWHLESIGISDLDQKLQVDPIIVEFERKEQYHDNQYEISLPWNTSVRTKMVENYGQVMSCLQSLLLKQDKDPELKSRYHAVLQE